jgi:hypothetical protein
MLAGVRLGLPIGDIRTADIFAALFDYLVGREQ